MNNQAVVRVALRVGIVAGAVCIAWVLMLYLTDQNPFGPKRLMSIFVGPIAVLVGQWKLRRYFPEGPGMGRALLAGCIVALTAAALSAVGVYTLGRMAGPLVERNRQEMEKIVRAERKNFDTEARFQQTLSSIAATPQALAADDFNKKLVLAFLLSVPGAIFFRK